jgi:hypothetical protein
MKELENRHIVEHDNKGITEKIIEIEAKLQIHLEKSEENDAKFHNLQERLINAENPEVKKQIITEIRKLSDLEFYPEERYAYSEFVKKFHEYMKDLVEIRQNFKSDLIAYDNHIYVTNLYNQYLKETFDKFFGEYKAGADSISQKLEHLLPFSEFEKWLFYHANSLCYREGIESPNYDDVNKMILTKPYGDGSLYPQNRIWQIVSEVGIIRFRAWRDYYCDLAIIENKRQQFKNLSS